MPLQNDRYLRALRREPVDKTPVWVMRQAGRYLPEYRKIREQAGSFMDLCTNPELACEVTMQPLRRFDLDAAILFSDILTIPDAMGLGLHFVAGEGPKFHDPVRTEAEIAKLAVPDMHDTLQYVFDAVSLIRKTLDGKVPLIGFSGSPWTLATYMVEGGSSKAFSLVKGLAYHSPKAMHQLLSVLADSVTEYLRCQIEAGAQSLMIFDTWGGTLSPHMYKEFSVQYMQRIVEGLPLNGAEGRIPVTLFSKGVGQNMRFLADTGCDGVGVDWTVDMADARQWTGDKVALQGNLDPCALEGTPETIRADVKRVMQSYGKGPGHVFNLGHGVHPGINPDMVKVMVDAVHEG